MQGTLSQYPLVEVIREIIAEEWSGALRLTQERVKLVFYWERGALVYAVSNLKQFRLAECLRRAEKVTEAQLREADAAASPDARLAQTLLQQGVIERATLNSVTTWQASEIIKLALQWPDGEWQLEARVRPAEKATIDLPFQTLLLEAARKIPLELVKQRLSLLQDSFAPAAYDLQNAPLIPNEGFVLTRVINETSLTDLLTLSGLPENATLQATYVLSVSGYLKRASWPSAFTLALPTVATELEAEDKEAAIVDEGLRAKRELDAYLSRMGVATDYYQMLGAEPSVDLSQIKSTYYRLARKFHPDLFRMAEASLRSRIEAEFSRVTRAYETLKDEKTRATYDAKLATGTARHVPSKVVTPPVSKPTPTPPVAAPKPTPPPVKVPPPVKTTIPPPVSVQPPPASAPASVNLPLARHAPARSAAPDANPMAPFMSRDDNRRDAFYMPPSETRTPQKVDALMQKRAIEQFQKGLSALASRDHIAAIACLAEAARLDPTQARHHAYFGRALSGNPNARRQAEAELTEAISMEPNNLDYQFMLAEFYWNAGFPLRCQGEVKRILQKDPFHPEARSLRDKLSNKI